MKSTIDWNEIVARLPKKRRDDLYLEAITILSESEGENEEAPTKRKRNKNYPKVREWAKEGDGKLLAGPGRKFKINKDKDSPFRSDSKAGKLWGLIRESRNDVITSEGISSVGVGVGLRSADSIWVLWSKRLVDITE